MAQLLETKTAVIYGAAGAIGRAVARAFAHEGAHVHLTSHRLSSVEQIDAEIEAAGGKATAAEVDALDESAIEEHLGNIIKDGYASGLGIKAEDALVGLAGTTMLKRLPTLEELSNVASFVASDRASALTGSVIKIDCGASSGQVATL